MYWHCSASTNTEYKFLSSTDRRTLHCPHQLALFHKPVAIPASRRNQLGRQHKLAQRYRLASCFFSTLLDTYHEKSFPFHFYSTHSGNRHPRRNILLQCKTCFLPSQVSRQMTAKFASGSPGVRAALSNPAHTQYVTSAAWRTSGNLESS